MGVAVANKSLKPTLVLRSKKNPEPILYRIDQKECSIGRDQDNFIALDSRAVSRKHTTILEDGEAFFVIDNKSANGTSLNNRRLISGEKNILRPGDKIQIEDFEFTFQMIDSQNVSDPYDVTDTDILEVKMIKKILKAIDKETAPSFEILKGSQKGDRRVLEDKTQTLIIGRDADCDWMIDDDTISRHHAKLTKKWDVITLRDLKSKNGTYVNKKQIRERQLRDGDTILVGMVPLRFRNPQDVNVEALAPKLKTEEEMSEKSVPPHDNDGLTKDQQADKLRALTPSEAEAQDEEGSISVSQMTGSSQVTRTKRFGTAEMTWIIIGGVVFVLCLYGIVSLLK